MNAQLPKYMSIKDFCAYSGFSRYQFMRLADKAGIRVRSISSDYRTKWINVQEALHAIENLPEADKEVPCNLPDTAA
jgi:hypothetical protein